MASLNMVTLLTLLPFLSLVVASPSPQDGATPGYTANKRGSSNAPTPLSFESVGDTGVSAQQVSLLSNLMPEKMLMTAVRCSWVMTRRFMSLTRQKTTLSPLTARTAPIPHGPPSMTLRRTNVSSEPFIHVYMLLTACTSDRTLDVYSNTFCAGGNVLGNGTWVIFGGNQRKCAVFSPFRKIADAFFWHSRHNRWCRLYRCCCLQRYRWRKRHPNDQPLYRRNMRVHPRRNLL